MREHSRLDAILCVVDAEQLFAAPETMQLKLFQMACADLMILNKVDLVDAGRVAAIEAFLDGRFHRYRLIEASHGNVPLEILLSAGRLDPALGGADAHERGARHGVTPHGAAHEHASAFDTWSFETDRPLSLAALRDAASKLPASVYRAKGVVFASDAPERRVVLQVVGRRVDISLADPWGARTPRTRIVAIGAATTLEPVTLRACFERCIDDALATQPAAMAPRSLAPRSPGLDSTRGILEIANI